MKKTRGNGYKLYQKRFCLDIRKCFIVFACLFFYSEVDHWNSVSGDVVKFPLLEVFKMQLERLLDNLISASFWTRSSFEITSKMGYFMIL